MTQQAASTMTEALSQIWRCVLRRSSIRIEDNFFELGGDPWLAVKIFAEIRKEYGRELSPLVIYNAPTIATLAAVLGQPVAPRIPALLPMSAGSDQQPVFVAHGLGGNVMEFFELAGHIRSRHPIYGMQARGTDGVDEPLNRIEDMAQFYLAAIKELQLNGPYLLIGYSLGGLVVLEMAQRLSEVGEEVRLLAMVDAYPHFRHLSIRQRARLITRRAGRRASAIGKRFLSLSQEKKGQEAERPPIGASFTPAMQRVREKSYQALLRYRPRPYNGEIKFVKAEEVSSFPDDPTSVWAHLANKFEVETVPGDHKEILTKHFRELASVLSRYLQEAIGSQ
ncbi:MAG TPA: alpha/beta fold hydrolase [Candidatus Acidoferrales bacterium]|nr:alpha/beta fold hydrolase [Candidatus Acidoferrales bacterium]